MNHKKTADFYCSKGSISNVDDYLNFAKEKFEDNVNNKKTTECLFEDFVLHKTIGIGAFGRVLLVNHKSDNKSLLAMKVMKKEQMLRKNYLRHALNEKLFLSAIRHPFIIHMEYYVQDLCNIYFVMPFAVGGDMFTHISNEGVLGEGSTKFYSAQIILALEYLHVLDIVYRDLKPENVLIDEHGFIKLTDLGLSKRIAKRTTTMCGTPQYLAPEIIAFKPYGKSVDWWALGVVMFEMVAGDVPFNADSERALYNKILNGKLKIPSNFSPDFSDLVKNLLQIDLTKRYGNLKNGVNDIKQHRFFKTIDWLLLYNKRVEAPFIPNFKKFSDTSNFERYSDEDVTVICDDVDQSYFANF